jgi:phosphopantetheine adenylyltransferase/uncharacterized protein (UPF0218 family)
METRALVAGTFDTIHKGHEAILFAALSRGTDITVALTSDTYTSTYKHGASLPYINRKSTLEKWLENKLTGKTITIIPIDDPYEPAVSGDFDCIIVSTQTRSRAEEINRKRQEKGLKALEIIEVPMVEAVDGEPISSTRVRSGTIDTQGRLMMPDSMRDELIRPVGILLQDEAEIDRSIKEIQKNVIITVGDVTTSRLMKAGVTPSLAIVDLMVQRKSFKTFDAYGFSPFVRIMRSVSGPGFIADSAVEAISDWATDEKARRHIPYAIIVQGEEDLLVLPAIVASPVGAVVLYGQPPSNVSKEGLVMVTVTKELQTRIEEILSRFTSVKEE